jgi:putative transposase
MARQWRIEFPGAFYHVMGRGNGSQDIYLSDIDRRIFLDLIGEFYDRFNIDVYAYVLMGNHYHLLLRTLEANLSRAMQWFGTSYTQKFNMHNQRCGHLFQGRFKSILVENDAYLLRLSCYIHRNPLRAGIVERLVDYPWSSYPFYAYKYKPPEWLKTQKLLNQLSGEDLNKSYRARVQHYSGERGNIWEDVKHGLIYGSQKFVDDVKKRFARDTKDVELPQNNSILKNFDLKEVLRIASEHLGFDLEAARKVKKIGPAEKDNRDLLIYFLRQTGRVPNAAIGANFGLSYSAVSKRANMIAKRMSSNHDIREKYDYLKTMIEI